MCSRWRMILNQGEYHRFWQSGPDYCGSETCATGTTEDFSDYSTHPQPTQKLSCTHPQNCQLNRHVCFNCKHPNPSTTHRKHSPHPQSGKPRIIADWSCTCCASGKNHVFIFRAKIFYSLSHFLKKYKIKKINIYIITNKVLINHCTFFYKSFFFLPKRQLQK